MDKFHADMRETLEQYRTFSDQEIHPVLLQQLAEGHELRDRKNFVGHAAGGVFVLSPDLRQVLMIHHNILKRRFHPGGHAEMRDEVIRESAFRELVEETGLSLDSVSHVVGWEETPFDIDTHVIPANPKKEEPEHLHHEFRYLVVLKPEYLDQVTLDANEVSGRKRIDLSDEHNIQEKIRNKLLRIIGF